MPCDAGVEFGGGTLMVSEDLSSYLTSGTLNHH